jgi:protein-S-isoprenylcysteine O-methyltransferase Ste14
MTFSKPYADRVAKLRVPCGFVLAAALVWLAAPTHASMLIGLPVAVSGLALRAWAAGHLEKNRDLAQSGPYAHLRNPLYAGTLLVAAGFAISARRWELDVLFTAAFVFIYLPVVDLEEQHLRQLFKAYESYARRVPKFFPRVTPSPGGSKSFRWQIYARNHEYEALAGFVAAAALLLWKMGRA